MRRIRPLPFARLIVKIHLRRCRFHGRICCCVFLQTHTFDVVTLTHLTGWYRTFTHMTWLEYTNEGVLFSYFLRFPKCASRFGQKLNPLRRVGWGGAFAQEFDSEFRSQRHCPDIQSFQGPCPSRDFHGTRISARLARRAVVEVHARGFSCTRIAPGHCQSRLHKQLLRLGPPLVVERRFAGECRPGASPDTFNGVLFHGVHRLLK